MQFVTRPAFLTFSRALNFCCLQLLIHAAQLQSPLQLSRLDLECFLSTQRSKPTQKVLLRVILFFGAQKKCSNECVCSKQCSNESFTQKRAQMSGLKRRAVSDMRIEINTGYSSVSIVYVFVSSHSPCETCLI